MLNHCTVHFETPRAYRSKSSAVVPHFYTFMLLSMFINIFGVRAYSHSRELALLNSRNVLGRRCGFLYNDSSLRHAINAPLVPLGSMGQPYYPYSQQVVGNNYQVPITTNPITSSTYVTPQTQQYGYSQRSYQQPYYYNSSSVSPYSSGGGTGYGTGYGTGSYGYQRRNYGARPMQPAQPTPPPVHWDIESLVEIKKDFYDLSPEADARSGEEIEQLLKSHNIIIDGEYPLPKPVNTFDEAVFNPEIQRLIKESGFVEPTPIQKVGWTCCLTGRDVIGVSRTGSGKTLAYLLPGILHAIAQPPIGHGQGPIVLILAPTRELCQQIYKESQRYINALGLRGTVIFGGVPRIPQIQRLAMGTEVVVATPGRLLDLLTTGNVKLDRVSYLVLDEADRMLDMGFEPQIRSIYTQVRPDRQSMMFSATLPNNIRKLARDFCKEDCIYIQVGNLELTANPNINQQVEVVTPHTLNQRVIDYITTSVQGKKILVFCETRFACEQLVGELAYKRINAMALHGGKTQTARDRIMNIFRSSPNAILVATDVASRGLDISDIDHVLSVDIPRSLEDYIHRIGRTGRGNASGNSRLFFVNQPGDEFRRRFAVDLAQLLQQCSQATPSELMAIANAS